MTKFQDSKDYMHGSSPVTGILLNNLGTLLHEAGRCREAITCYQEAITCQPDFADAHLNLALSLLLLGEYVLTIEKWRFREI